MDEDSSSINEVNDQDVHHQDFHGTNVEDPIVAKNEMQNVHNLNLESSATRGMHFTSIDALFKFYQKHANSK